MFVISFFDLQVFTIPVFQGKLYIYIYNIYSGIWSFQSISASCLQLFYCIFLVYVSQEYNLPFSFTVQSLCGLGVRVIQALEEEFGSSPSVSIVLNSLRNTTIGCIVFESLVEFCYESIWP